MTVHFSKKLLSLTVLATVALLLLSAVVPAVLPAPAQASSEDFVRSITVVGKGEVYAKPDIAYTNIGVEVMALTVVDALAQSNEQLDNILAALTDLGIARNDLQTSNFSINFERQMSDVFLPVPEGGAVESAPVPETPSGFYRVSNMVQVTIRDLDQVGDVLDAATAAGANNVWGVNFGLDDTADLEADAREKAVADARQRAESLAALTGVEIGAVISVSEVVGGGSQPMFAEAAQDRGYGGGTPVEAGVLAFSTQIQIVYEIQ